MSEVQYHPEQLIDCGSVQLACDSFGDPSHPPMLLIMGLATQMIFWDERFCHMLASRGYWVIRFDNRDVGRSTIMHEHAPPTAWDMLKSYFFNIPAPASYNLNTMAQDVIALMNALRIDKAHLVGASMGGMIAQWIAIEYPERAKTLTSIMSTTGNRKLMSPRLKMALALLRRRKGEAEDQIQKTLEFWRILHGPEFEFEQDWFQASIERAFQRGFSSAGVQRQLAAIGASQERTELLSKLELPTLIMHGDIDPLVDIRNGQATADAISHAKYKVYSGMGHTMPQELWEDMTKEIHNLAITGVTE